MDLAERISRIGVSATMKAAATAESLRRSGVDVVDLTAGEPDFPTPEHIKQAAIQAIEENFTRYTAAAGILELRQAVCDRHAAEYSTSYQPSECVISAGGKHAVFNLLQVLVGSGDEVIVPVPYWITYVDLVRFAGGKCILAETREEEDFTLSAGRIEPLLTPATRGIIVNSPNNPSGAAVGRAGFERIYELASRRGLWIVTDECYGRLLFDGHPFSAAAFPGAKERVFVAGSLSKSYAMTGWRIGYSLAPAAVTEAIQRLQSHTTSNISSISQKAALAALRGPQDAVALMRDEYRRRSRYVAGRLRSMPGVRCTEPRGAFYAYPNVGAVLEKAGIPGTDSFCRLLLERTSVATVPGEAFGLPGHIRISCAASAEALERGLSRMHTFIAELMQ